MSRTRLLTLKQFKERLDKLSGKKKNDFIKKQLTKTGAKLLEKTQKRTPVDTGLLKESWRVNKPTKVRGGWEIKIKNNAKGGWGTTNYPDGDYYATHVEFGHFMPNGTYIEPKFMLTRSIHEIQARLPEELGVEFSLWVNKVLEENYD